MNPCSRTQGNAAGSATTSAVNGWVVAAITIALGAFGAFAAMTAPLLFGPLAATVMASERLLRATRARGARLTALWLALAMAWGAWAVWMLHAPLLSNVRLQTATLLLVLANAGCWAWSRAASGVHWRFDALPIAAASALALAILYDGSAPLAHTSVMASIALALVGVERVLMMCIGPSMNNVMRSLPAAGGEGLQPFAWTPALAPARRS